VKVTKSVYLKSFAAIVVVLALVRCVFPSVAEPRTAAEGQQVSAQAEVSDADDVDIPVEPNESTADDPTADESTAKEPTAKEPTADEPMPDVSSEAAGESSVAATWTPHPIRSVPSYADAFPDMQDVQIQAANKYGVSPVQNRAEAERRKMELVYVGANPYFFVEPLRSSIPYLVPRASVLLQDIGRNFFDSLQIKGVPLSKIIVTSVLRSKDDVSRLRGHNGNATENSCHLYGTTFDICYNRYKTVAPPDDPRRRAVRNDTLKWVLSEVLRDLRQQQRCYVKYEVKQGCFHITVR